MQRVALSRVFDVIAVRPPYYALCDLAFDGDDRVEASFSPEQPKRREEGPCAAAEVGRHLAILGSCAVALQRDEPRYLLARRATLTRVCDGPGHAETLRASARGEWIGKRTARAVATAYVGGDEVFTLDVEYAAMRPSVFERVHAASVLTEETLPAPDSPYAALPTPVASELTERSVVAGVPQVRAEQCAGHFPRAPALPVAILMHYLSSTAGLLLAHRRGAQARYRVQRAVVAADALAFAGSHLSLRAHAERGDGLRYACRARDAGGTTVGSMTLQLQLVD